LGNSCVQRFTSSGSFLEKWGRYGTGNGEFDYAWGVSVSPDGERVYACEMFSHRVQYSKEVGAVAPASLGKVKALFR